MKAVSDFLVKNPIQYLSTIGINGKPQVRPFQFMLEDNGKLFYCTSNQKPVYQEIKNNPFIELCTSNERFEWIRLEGKVIFSNDIKIKEKIINNNDLVKSIYKTSDNPFFEVFYLDQAKATIADFSGNPPIQYTL